MTTSITEPPKQPLTFIEKAWEFAKGVKDTVIEYIPRGIMMSAAILGGSFLLGKVIPGADLLGAGATFAEQGAAGIGKMMLRSLVIGGSLAGGVGGWRAASAAAKTREAEILAQTQGREMPQREVGPERQREVGYASNYKPQADLPSIKPAAGRAAAPSLPG